MGGGFANDDQSVIPFLELPPPRYDQLGGFAIGQKGVY